MPFNFENFVAAPSIELLNLAKKTDLLNIADHYALTSVLPSMLKHEIKNILIKVLVDEEILDPSGLSSVLVTQNDFKFRELEVQRQIQLEKVKIRTGRKNKSRTVGAGRKNAEKIAMEKEK